MRRATVITISAVVVGLAAGATTLAVAWRASAPTEGDQYAIAEPSPDPEPTPTPTADDRYTITEPYAYPEVDFYHENTAENLELLRIPQDVLDAMTTEALAWSVVGFPYSANYFASSQLDGGVDFLRPQCDALDALLERDDAEAAVRAVRTAFVAGEVEDEFDLLKIRLLDGILAWL